MKRIQIGIFEATLRLTEWECEDGRVLGILRMYTDEIEITGSVPDVEQHIIDGLRSRLPAFTVIEDESLPDTGEAVF